MSTDFTNFHDNDVILPLHINQTFTPINSLEDGSAWYAEDIGTVDAYKVDFSTGNEISGYTPGLLVNFKAETANTGACTLTVTGPSGDLSPVALTKRGGEPLSGNDIAAGQVVSVVFTDDSGSNPRFEVIGGLSVATSASASWALFTVLESDLTLSDLSNQNLGLGSRLAGSELVVNPNKRVTLSEGLYSVVFSVTCEIHSGEALEVGLFDYSDTTPVEISGSARAVIGHETLHHSPNGEAIVVVPKSETLELGLRTGFNSVDGSIKAGGGYLKVVKISGEVSNPAGNVGSLDDLSDVEIGSTPSQGDILRYDSSAGAFKPEAFTVDAAQIGAGTVSNTEFGYLDGVSSPLQSQLDGKAASSHTHSVGQITGTLPIAQGGTGAGTASGARTNLDVPSNSELTSGLAAKQDASEKGQASGYASLDSNSKVPQTQIPSGIDAANIGAGNVGNTEFGYLDGVTSSIQTQLDGKAPSSHTHSVSEGGTGLTSLGAAKRLLYSTSASALATLAAGANGQILYMGSSAPYWGNPPATGVTGSGANTRLALWSGSSSLSSNSTLYLTSSILYAPSFSASDGRFRSSAGATYLPNLRNQSFSAALYWNSTNGEVGYLYSRAVHKKNIKTIESSIDDLMKWRPVTFEWKEAFGGQPDLGLISEEVESVFPLAASYDEDWEYIDEETGEYARDEEHRPKKIQGTMVPAGVKYERAWLPMLAAVQDFYRKYQSLETEVETLKAKVAALE